MDANAQPERRGIQRATGQRVEDAKLSRAHQRLRRPEAHRGLHDLIVGNLLLHKAPPPGAAVRFWVRRVARSQEQSCTNTRLFCINSFSTTDAYGGKGVALTGKAAGIGTYSHETGTHQV